MVHWDLSPTFFSLEYAGELRIIALRRRVQNTKPLSKKKKEKKTIYKHTRYRKHTTKLEQNQAIYLATNSNCDNPSAPARDQR